MWMPSRWRKQRSVSNIRLMIKETYILKSVDGHKNRREGKKSVRRWNTRDKNLQKNDKFFWELLDTGGKDHAGKTSAYYYAGDDI